MKFPQKSRIVSILLAAVVLLLAWLLLSSVSNKEGAQSIERIPNPSNEPTNLPIKPAKTK